MSDNGRCQPDLICVYRSKTSLIIRGLGRIGGAGSKPSTDVLKTRLTSVLSLVGVTRSFEVLDAIQFASAVAPVYSVRLCSFEAVDDLLREFSKFTRRREPVARPPELDNVALYHAVTPGTRIRISLLRVSCLC